jgi:hypothetical protein
MRSLADPSPNPALATGSSNGGNLPGANHSLCECPKFHNWVPCNRISTLAKAAKRDEDRRASALKFSTAPYKNP